MLRTIGFLLLSSLCTAQFPNITSFANKTTFPDEQTENVTLYMSQAEILSLYSPALFHELWRDQCITQQVYPEFKVPYGFVQPFSPFENMFWVGQSEVSAWAFNTTDGIVLIDTLDNTDEAKAILIPNLEFFGFSGSDIKHVIITHEHADHYVNLTHTYLSK